MRTKVAALLTSAVVLSGCAGLTGDTSPGLSGLGNGDVAARGGGAVVTVDELQAYVDETIAAGALSSQQLTGSPLERQVQLQTLLLNNRFQIELATVAAADELGVEVTAADVDDAIDQAIEDAGGDDAFESELTASGQTLEVFRRTQEAVLLRQAISDALAAADPLSDDEVRASYEARSGEFEQASVSHILVETEDEALDVLDRLEAGEDFGAVAEEVSNDPGSGANGGSLGLNPRGTFVAPFEAAIWDGPATVGELVGPIETQFGWHVLRVDEFVVTAEDEALEQVREELEQGRGDELFGVWFQELRAGTDVEVAGRFGRWDEASLNIVRDTPTAQQ